MPCSAACVVLRCFSATSLSCKARASLALSSSMDRSSCAFSFSACFHFYNKRKKIKHTPKGQESVRFRNLRPRGRR